MAKPIVKLTPAVRRQQRELAMELPAIKAKLMRLGLIHSAHSCELVVKMIGWEIAAIENDRWPKDIPQELLDVNTQIVSETP